MGIRRTAFAAIVIAWMSGLRTYSAKEALCNRLVWDGRRWRFLTIKRAAIARKEMP